MPIERYVINFLQEVPLPPLGRVDVRYFMPNNLKMTLSRPPPNKLPMTDFSYRPLFTSLSVENIIIVFQCLCAELTVCICSDNLSLLTPVQEAFLSFLFPLVWQGMTWIYLYILDQQTYTIVNIIHCLFGEFYCHITDLWPLLPFIPLSLYIPLTSKLIYSFW